MNAFAAIRTIMKRELGGYFTSPIAYVVDAVFLLVAGYTFALTSVPSGFRICSFSGASARWA